MKRRGGVAVLVAAGMSWWSGGSALSSAPPTYPPDVQAAVAAGNVARCGDGTFSDNTEFDNTCSSHDDVDEWLAPFGSCRDGTVVAMSEDTDCGDHDGFDVLLPLDFVPTARPDDIARCANGTFSNNSDLEATCSSNGGVAEWSAPFGSCGDGRVIAMTPGSSCDGHDGFDRLLPVDYLPTPTATDLARCGNATHSDNTHFDDTCSSSGGVTVWLAPTGVCNDGTEVAIGPDTDCGGDHDGFGHLNLIEVATCADGSTSTYLYLPNTCADAGGVETWLAEILECIDGALLELNEDASCDGHGGIAGVSDIPSAPTTTIPPSTTSVEPTTSASATATAPPPTTLAPAAPSPTAPPSTAPMSSVVVPVAAVVNVLPIGVGSDGPEVAAVQARLGVGVDCEFGDQTRQAVEQWQRDHGRPVTGSIDVTDWSALAVPGLWGDDTDGNGQIDPPEEVTLACDGHVELPAWPEVSSTALEFIDADECHIFETNDSGEVVWFECTRSKPNDEDVAVSYITPDSDPVAALEWAETLPDYNEVVAVLFAIDGGGVLYQHSGHWEMFDVGPYPALDVVDTDCAPFPETNPELCPNAVETVDYDLSSEATCVMRTAVRLGSSGDDVRCLQQRLSAVTRGGDPIVVDGGFGPGTEAAVQQFQEANGLVVDGIAGAQTALLLGIWDPAPASQQPVVALADAGSCDPAYPTVCIPPAPPDLNCGDVPHRRFQVLPPDPHGFDGNDNDGVGCES